MNFAGLALALPLAIALTAWQVLHFSAFRRTLAALESGCPTVGPPRAAGTVFPARPGCDPPPPGSVLGAWPWL